ncbi:MAG: tail fiber domain-containing protein [Ferruginibacter sp.]
MKRYYLLLLSAITPALLWSQGNVGIGAPATKARLEILNATGAGTTTAVFGSESTGISFQQNLPSIGFNQYRDAAGGYGKYIGPGYAALQYLDPGNGGMALDMQPVSGIKNATMGALNRAFTLFPNGTVILGYNNVNTNLGLDANNSAYFYGTQYRSGINAPFTSFQPGKDGGTTYINDLPGNNVVMGLKAAINTNPFYLTTLSIRHATAGNGMLLIEQNGANSWEWYVSNDNPVWIGQKYNGLLIGDYNPNTGVHGYVSDIRLKTAIRPLAPVLQNLLQIQTVQYRMKSASPDTPLTQGFIAQNIRTLFPELVSIIENHDPGNKGLTDLHMLNYSQFFVLAIKAIQEQQEQIAALTKEISELDK